MKRFLINEDFKKSLRGSGFSFNVLSSKVGFDVKNVYYKNLSIREDHLFKLKPYIHFESKMKDFEFDPTPNLGDFSSSLLVGQVSQTPDLAEFIGIMFGDGNIYRNQLRISLDKRQVIYIKYVGDLFLRLFGFRMKLRLVNGTNQAYLYSYNKDLVRLLLDFGLQRGDKILNQVRVPCWIKQNRSYSQRFIRGLIDTDGCIYFCKRDKKYYVKFTNCNKALLSGFEEMSREQGFDFVRSGSKSRVLYKGDQVVRFINDVGTFKAVGKLHPVWD